MEMEQGKIVQIAEQKAIIQMEASSHCNTCGARHSCTALSGEMVRQIEIPIIKNIKVGDNVTISYQPRNRIISAFLVFILPILFLILGYFIGLYFWGSEGKAILTSFAGLILAFIFTWWLNKILSKKNNFLPTILKVED